MGAFRSLLAWWIGGASSSTVPPLVGAHFERQSISFTGPEQQGISQAGFERQMIATTGPVAQGINQ